MRKLRDYQEEEVGKLRAEMVKLRRARKPVRFLHQVPTGGGKTTIAAAIARMAAEKGKRVWFTAHTTEILDQALERLQQEIGVAEVGWFRSGSTRIAPIMVVSVGTVHARLRAGKPVPLAPDLWFVDECHHAPASTWHRVLELGGGCVLIGLSATPYRFDGSGLGETFQSVVVGPSPRRLVELGHLVPPEIWSYPPKGNELSGDVVSTWEEKARGLKTICFATNTTHSRGLVDSFRQAGYKAEHLDGETPKGTRKRILEGLDAGVLDVVSNVNCLTEGFDLPAIACLILARSVKSEQFYVQGVGRGLRASPGKEKLILLDHGGCAIRFGNPLAHRPADLSGRRKFNEKKLPEDERLRLCESCFRVSPGSARACIYCLTEFESPLPRTVEKRKLERFNGTDRVPAADRVARLRSLDAQRKRLGHKPFWTDYRYLEIYGKLAYEDKELMSALSPDEKRAYIGERFRKKRAKA